MRKLLFIALLLLTGCVSIARADTSIDIPGLGILDLSNLVKNTGAMYAYDQHGRNWAGATVRALWYPNENGSADNAWLGLEGAILWDTARGQPAGFVGWVGLRADTLGAKIFGTMPRVGYLAVPSIEFGPMGGYLTTLDQWIYGVGVAKHF